MKTYTLICKKCGCQNCDRLERMLKDAGIDIPKLYAEDCFDLCVANGIQSVPCLMVNNDETGEQWLVFTPEQIIKELKHNG